VIPASFDVEQAAAVRGSIFDQGDRA
jgi:hypothetical protein